MQRLLAFYLLLAAIIGDEDPAFAGGSYAVAQKYRHDMTAWDALTVQQQEAAIGYQRVVLQAFHEVDDALTALQAEQRRFAALTAAVEASREAARRARTPAERLAAEQAALSIELQRVESSAALPAGVVRLYKALGGGWEGAFPRTDPAAPR